MPWGVVAAGLAAAGSIYSANKSSKATNKASKRSLAAAGSANALLEQGYGEAEERLSPYIASETAANKQLMAEMGLSPDYSAQIESTTSRIDEIKAQLDDLGVTSTGGGGGGNLENYIKFKDTISPTRSYFSRKKGDKARRKARRARAQRLQDAKDLTAELQTEQEKLAEYQQFEEAPQNQPGTAYMETPGYQGAIDEGTRVVNQGSANEGSLYSGARGLALRDVGQQVQQSYYTNYMNILQNMATPTSTTNLSNIGIQQAGNIGNNNIAATARASNFDLAGVEAENAATADIIGGITSGVGAYMNRPQSQPYTGGQYNGGAVNQTDYSAWV